MSKASDRTIPQSMRHKRILTLAGERPHASLEDLADEIPAVTTELVETVLDKYGDPAAEHEEAGSENGVDADTSVEDATNEQHPVEGEEATGSSENDPSSGNDPPTETESEGQEQVSGQETTLKELPSESDLTDVQQETLRLIAANPLATQQDLANTLGVSAPAISKRVNTIKGFEWEQRARMVEEILDLNSADDDLEPMATDNTTANDQLATVTRRLEELEERMAEYTASPDTESLFADVDLAHKVIHACLESERISEEEELQLLRAILS